MLGTRRKGQGQKSKKNAFTAQKGEIGTMQGRGMEQASDKREDRDVPLRAVRPPVHQAAVPELPSTENHHLVTVKKNIKSQIFVPSTAPNILVLPGFIFFSKFPLL